MRIEFELNKSGVWVDYTESVILEDFSIERSLNNKGQQQRDVTDSAIVATGESYVYLKTNLIDSVNRYSNEVGVKLIVDECSPAKEFLLDIENSNLKWCDDESCILEFDMIERDLEWNCLDDVLIADDWDNRFNDDAVPINPISYPRFRYCDVIRPYVLMIFLMNLSTLVDLILAPLMVIIAALNTLLGLGLKPFSMASMLLGCRRVHPAPFIRSYTDNICDYCTAFGTPLTSNVSTNPIFYDVASDYYNLTMLTAYVKKGFVSTNDKQYNRTNKPNWTLKRFYEELSLVFNARYFVYNGNFYFNRKDLIGTTIWGAGVQLDLTALPDSERVINGICFSYNGEKKTSRIYMKYGTDKMDAEGNQAISRFDGEDTDFTSDNYKNYIERHFENFGAQLYTYDGIDTFYDSLYYSVGFKWGFVDYEGRLKMRADNADLAKLIIWDGISPLKDAEAIGLDYNGTNFNVGEFVFEDGDDGTGFYPPPTIIGLWTAAFVSVDFEVKNYPMLTSPLQNAFQPNLWEFHKIDMPDPSKKTNIEFSFELNYCCDYLDLDMYQKVQLNATDIGEINFVKIDYSKMVVEVKGNLIN